MWDLEIRWLGDGRCVHTAAAERRDRTWLLLSWATIDAPMAASERGRSGNQSSGAGEAKSPPGS